MRRASQTRSDRRVERTQTLILGAFFALVQERRFDELKTSEIIEAAGIGKSTFYEHFSDKNDLLARSLDGPFLALARSPGNVEAAVRVLAHFWERRSLSRVILSGQTRSVVVTCMANALRAQYPISSKTDYAMIVARASGLVAVLAEWISGNLDISAKDLASLMANEIETLQNPREAEPQA